MPENKFKVGDRLKVLYEFGDEHNDIHWLPEGSVWTVLKTFNNNFVLEGYQKFRGLNSLSYWGNTGKPLFEVVTGDPIKDADNSLFKIETLTKKILNTGSYVNGVVKVENCSIRDHINLEIESGFYDKKTLEGLIAFLQEAVLYVRED